ncbi:hypothetical protein V8E53_007130 [Lactarius tabidus]
MTLCPLYLILLLPSFRSNGMLLLSFSPPLWPQHDLQLAPLVDSFRMFGSRYQTGSPSTEDNLRMARVTVPYLSLSASYRKRQVRQGSGPHVPHRPNRWQLHADRLRPFHSNSFFFISGLGPFQFQPRHYFRPKITIPKGQSIQPSHFLPQIRFVQCFHHCWEPAGVCLLVTRVSCCDYGADSDGDVGYSARSWRLASISPIIHDVWHKYLSVIRNPTHQPYGLWQANLL